MTAVVTPIQTFQAGHGWTCSGTGVTYNLNDTVTHMIGTQSLQWTNGAGNNGYASGLNATPRDLTGCSIRLWIKRGASASNANIRFQVGQGSLSGTDPNGYYEWIYYIDGDNPFILENTWSLITLSFADAVKHGTLGNSAITSWRCASFGSSPMAVNIQSIEIIKDTALNTAFPYGVCSITFDDGLRSPHDTQAFQHMLNRGFPGTIYPVTTYIGGGDRLTAEELLKYHTAGWEISSHGTSALHNITVGALPGLRTSVIAAGLAASQDDILRIIGQEDEMGFCYPMGAFGVSRDGDRTDGLLADAGYKYGRTTHGGPTLPAPSKGMTHETLPPGDPFRLRAISSISPVTSSTHVRPTDVVDIIQRGNAGSWIIITFHVIVSGSDSPSTTMECHIDDFDYIMQAIADSHMAVRTVSDVIANITPVPQGLSSDVGVAVGGFSKQVIFDLPSAIASGDGVAIGVFGSETPFPTSKASDDGVAGGAFQIQETFAIPSTIASNTGTAIGGIENLGIFLVPESGSTGDGVASGAFGSLIPFPESRSSDDGAGLGAFGSIIAMPIAIASDTGEAAGELAIVKVKYQKPKQPVSIVDQMNFQALDSNFIATEVVEGYNSIIWTDRYSEVGDFELHGPMNGPLLSIATGSSYIFNSVTKGLMVIEKVKATYSEEDGDTLTISGRSIGSILDRRVIQKSETIKNPSDLRLSQTICNLVNANFGPATPNRYWSKLQIVNATSQLSLRLSVDVSMQVTMGDSLLKVVTDACSTFGLGQKCIFVPSTKSVQFLVYEGKDRSVIGPNLVLFSDLYDNLITADEEAIESGVKNVVLVVGNAEDPATKTPRLPQLVGTATGLDRREMYLKADQTDTIYNANGTECPMPPADYIAALRKLGTDELTKPSSQLVRNYTGEILETTSSRYGVDFELGDIVAFRLPHHATTNIARLTGITFSDDSNTGKSLVPTFDYSV